MGVPPLAMYLTSSPVANPWASIWIVSFVPLTWPRSTSLPVLRDPAAVSVPLTSEMISLRSKFKAIPMPAVPFTKILVVALAELLILPLALTLILPADESIVTPLSTIALEMVLLLATAIEKPASCELTGVPKNPILPKTLADTSSLVVTSETTLTPFLPLMEVVPLIKVSAELSAWP